MILNLDVIYIYLKKLIHFQDINKCKLGHYYKNAVNAILSIKSIRISISFKG